MKIAPRARLLHGRWIGLGLAMLLLGAPEAVSAAARCTACTLIERDCKRLARGSVSRCIQSCRQETGSLSRAGCVAQCELLLGGVASQCTARQQACVNACEAATKRQCPRRCAGALQKCRREATRKDRDCREGCTSSHSEAQSKCTASPPRDRPACVAAARRDEVACTWRCEEVGMGETGGCHQQTRSCMSGCGDGPPEPDLPPFLYGPPGN